jgi:PHP family Zn ribbon phosphoesterase
VNSKAVQAVYAEMLESLGNEMAILREIPLSEIKKAAGTLIAEGVKRVREGKVKIAAGYDGEYGEINIFSDEERNSTEDQLQLF